MNQSLEVITSEPELELKKKPYASWCFRNYFSFLFNHCKSNNRTFLLPHEQRFQDTLNQKIASLVAITDDKKLASFFVLTVRVLLEEREVCSHADEWQIKSTKGFFIYPYGQNGKKLFYPKNNLSIKSFANGLYLDNKRLSGNQLLIQPAEGHLHYSSYQYQGAFLVALENDKAYLISQLDIEDYIFSVLRWESWPGWPLEVNKAFAIACRSYLIAKVVNANKKNNLFHIKNTNIHQTYNGVHVCHILKRAIEETRGLILSHNKKPIEAMFDCCCGDIIPAKLTGVDFVKAPYLARSYPCTFCKPCKIYSWNLEYSVEDFTEILRNAGHSVEEIYDMKVTKKDSAGAVQEVIVKDKNNHLTFNGREFYSLLTKIKSFCYSIEKKGSSIYFSGQGYGHHLGICQWGARRMVDAGWSYRSILHFYYPGSTIMELKNTV